MPGTQPQWRLQRKVEASGLPDAIHHGIANAYGIWARSVDGLKPKNYNFNAAVDLNAETIVKAVEGCAEIGESQEGWLYLAATLNGYSRRCAGWSAGDNMEGP